MKCKLDCMGVLIITPESQVEVYAAECWEKEVSGMIDETVHPLIKIDVDPDQLSD